MISQLSVPLNLITLSIMASSASRVLDSLSHKWLRKEEIGDRIRKGKWSRGERNSYHEWLERGTGNGKSTPKPWNWTSLSFRLRKPDCQELMALSWDLRQCNTCWNRRVKGEYSFTSVKYNEPLVAYMSSLIYLWNHGRNSAS